MGCGSDQLPATAYCGDAAHAYDAHRFATPQGRLFHDLELEQLQRVTRRLEAHARVLEIGCGTGRFSRYLAQTGFTVVATDPSPDMLAQAAAKCADLDNISFRQAEGRDLSFPEGAFDFVFAIRVTNQTASEAYALGTVREMIRVARRGGLVLVEFVNRDRPLARRSEDVKLSFGQIGGVARESHCDVLSRHGVLVFSQSVLNRVPGMLVPLWGGVERLAAIALWRWASRGYVLLRKR